MQRGRLYQIDTLPSGEEVRIPVLFCANENQAHFGSDEEVREAPPKAGTPRSTRARLHDGPGFFVWPADANPYSGENEPIVPLVGPELLPVMVLFPRLSRMAALTRSTPYPPLFANTQLEMRVALEAFPLLLKRPLKLFCDPALNSKLRRTSPDVPAPDIHAVWLLLFAVE